jgi:hypothetical protein
MIGLKIQQYKSEAARTLRGVESICSPPESPSLLLQAYMTRRKGNKTLIVYDLVLTLHWLGKLAEEDGEVRSESRAFASIHRLCITLHLRPTTGKRYHQGEGYV